MARKILISLNEAIKLVQKEKKDFLKAYLPLLEEKTLGGEVGI